jgi:hypothetical protein
MLTIDPSSPALDADEVAAAVQRLFPNAVRHPGDGLAETARRARAFADAAPPDQREALLRIVVPRLEQNARSYGPAYGLSISQEGAKAIRVVVRPRDVTFLAEKVPPRAVWERIVEFLKSQGTGKVWTTEEPVQFTRPFP